MPVAMKFCGLTRSADARLAESLGAAFLGFIFAPSPRRLDVKQAQALVHELDGERADGGGSSSPSAAGTDQPPRAPDSSVGVPGRRSGRVGVFSGATVREISGIVGALGLDVVQLHDLSEASRIREVREETGAVVWAVLPVGDAGLDEERLEIAREGDAILLDAKVEGMLGGTGRTFDWERARRRLETQGVDRPIILAGGLRAENVARAIELLAPDVVDVSSGIESAPGIKDPARMRAFAHAVHQAVQGVSSA